MRIAPEGWPFIVTGLLLVIVLGGGGWLASSRVPALGSWLTALTAVVALLTVFTAYFFRDPVRPNQAAVGEVLAPGDGRIVMITEVEEPDFLQGPAVRVSIFLSIFNVHVQRAPITGRVGHRDYKAGGFLVAWHPKASEENEQASVGIASGPHKVLVRQIAGLIARRVVTDPTKGDFVGQGSRIGIIRFGSRVDLFIPPDWELTCQVGDRAVGGRSVLARMPEEGAEGGGEA
jgi:phosphatidylserine decarboxylase